MKNAGKLYTLSHSPAGLDWAHIFFRMRYRLVFEILALPHRKRNNNNILFFCICIESLEDYGDLEFLMNILTTEGGK